MSDQDFDFGDAPKAEPKKKTSAPKADSKTSAKASAPVAVSAGGFEMTYTITALIAVVTLLVGLIGGIFIGKSITPATITYEAQGDSGTQSMQEMMGGEESGGAGTDIAPGSAPVLTDEQLQQGQGGMPAGHPPVGGDDAAAEDKPADEKKTDDKAEEKSAE